MIFKAGSHFRVEGKDGYGDEMMAWCTGCDKILEPQFISGGRGLCPKCQRVIGLHDEGMADAIQFSTTFPKKIADKIYQIMVTLHMDADIKLHRYHRSLQEAMQTVINGGHANPRLLEGLGASRAHRDVVVYNRDRFFKDVSTGADPVRLLEGWMTS